MPRYYNNYYGAKDQHADRIVRAFEQSLTLLRCVYHRVSQRWDLRISSSTGAGYYDLTLTAGKVKSNTSTCTCPDFERRQKPCKHMLCVLLRILKLKQHDFTSVREVNKSYEQITEAFLRLFHRDVQPEEDVKEAKGEQEVQESSTAEATSAAVTAVLEEEMCLICLLEFTPPAMPTEGGRGQDVVKCSSHCQRWLGHKECLNTWFLKSAFCPLCKGPQRTSHKHDDEPAYKRIRYAYNDANDDLDIDALQDQHDDETIVDANAFFQILED